MIRKAEMQDLPILAELACRLWPDNTVEELCSEMGEILAKPDAAFFLAYAEMCPLGLRNASFATTMWRGRILPRLAT